MRGLGFGDHDVLVVLGSGWQRAADAFGDVHAAAAIADLPGFVPPVAEGHGTEVRSYVVGDARVLAFLGRTHLYEGHGTAAVVHAVRTASALGCNAALLTNANGCLRPDWTPGTCVLLRDHLNLTARSPLTGGRFVDLSEVYSDDLRALARRVRPDLVEGVYAMLPGPHYETAAEGRMLARLGADVVGMSTVLEAIAAREASMQVLAISVVTVTEGLDVAIDPSEVVARAAESAAAMGPALVETISRMEGSR
jgi:purine-nucleoside phosphorylase